jgi:hypothetical protein
MRPTNEFRLSWTAAARHKASFCRGMGPAREGAGSPRIIWQPSWTWMPDYPFAQWLGSRNFITER